MISSITKQGIRNLSTVEQALEAAACLLRDRDHENLEALIARVQDWMGDHRGFLATLQEMHDAAFELSEAGL